MENVSTGLKWAIGVIVTLLIVAAGISVYMFANGYFKRAQDQTLAQSESLSREAYSLYDNSTVSGTDVLEAVKRFQNKPEFSVMIATGLQTTHYYPAGFDSCYAAPAAAPATQVATDAACGTTTPQSDMSDPDNAVFINVTARFDSEIFADANGEIRLIRFTQQ